MSHATSSVLVASCDGGYRRLAAAALAGAGFDVRTAVARAERIERLLVQRGPDVLVLDASAAGLVRIDRFIDRLPRPPALVIVADRADRSAGITDKWCTPAELVEAVRRAGRRPAGSHLHFVR